MLDVTMSEERSQGGSEFERFNRFPTLLFKLERDSNILTFDAMTLQFIIHDGSWLERFRREFTATTGPFDVISHEGSSLLKASSADTFDIIDPDALDAFEVLEPLPLMPMPLPLKPDAFHIQDGRLLDNALSIATLELTCPEFNNHEGSELESDKSVLTSLFKFDRDCNDAIFDDSCSLETFKAPTQAGNPPLPLLFKLKSK